MSLITRSLVLAAAVSVASLASIETASADTAPTAKTRPTTTTTTATPPAAASAAGQPVTIPAPPDVAAAPADALKTPSGLASKILKPGTGKDHPKAQDSVEVHYSGWTTDGKMFDSSVQRGQTAKFPLGRVIAGWTEGVQLMVVGEKRRFWIPEALAYGGKPGRPAGMLVFDIELLDFK